MKHDSRRLNVFCMILTAFLIFSQPPASAEENAQRAPILPLTVHGDAFKGTISALAVGDVNGDSTPDIVLAHDNRIVVTTIDEEGLKHLAAFDAGKGCTIVTVDAGNIDGNAAAEIFVTRLNTRGNPASVVLKWNGSGLQPIAADQSWYLRVTDDPEKGRLLMGQRRVTPAANDTGGLYAYRHFMPGVFELTWTGEMLQSDRRLPLPDDLDIYRFAHGDIFNDGKTRSIAYAADDSLRVYDADGSPRWAGEEILGGSPVFLESVSTTDSRSKDRTYLAQRLIVADLDGDGKVEVVTVHNHDAARGFVQRFRKYTHGRLIVLRWNRVNMKQIWSGETISGYISDFALADLNGDSRLEGVYAMVSSTGIARKTSSSIVVEQIGSLSDN